MSKIILIKIKGEEMEENIPILLVSILPKKEGYSEKILLEIKQIKKDNEDELLSGNWFKVKTNDFKRVLYLLMSVYFKHLLSKGYNINQLVYEYNNLVKSALRNAHKEYNYEKGIYIW